MNPSELNNFMSTGFITFLAAGVIILILKHWKGAEWTKIGSVILIAIILRDFAVNQGNNVFTVVRWVLKLVGIKM